MELATILEAIDAGVQTPEELMLEPMGDEIPEEEVPITGYELDDSDWEALQIIQDGRGASLSSETMEWLKTCGLVIPGEDGALFNLSQLAIDWLAWQS